MRSEALRVLRARSPPLVDYLQTSASHKRSPHPRPQEHNRGTRILEGGRVARVSYWEAAGAGAQPPRSTEHGFGDGPRGWQHCALRIRYPFFGERTLLSSLSPSSGRRLAHRAGLVDCHTQ